MKGFVWGLLLVSGGACAHPLVVQTARVHKAAYRPAITAFGRAHGPDRTVFKAPYDALMGPYVVAPGSRVATGAVIARLLPTSLAATVRAFSARVQAARTAFQQGQVLVHQGLITAAQAQALKAAWKADKAAFLAAARRLSRGVVRAPFPGTVRYRVAPGAWLIRGMDVAALAGAGGLYETAALTLHDANRLFVGARAGLAGWPPKDSGHVYALAARVDRLGLVRAYVRGVKAPLRPGEVVRLLLFGHRVTALSVPRQALVVRHARARIYLLRAGHAEPVTVQVEHLGAHRVFIKARLAPGALVIDSHVSRLRAGTAVRVAR